MSRRDAATEIPVTVISRAWEGKWMWFSFIQGFLEGWEKKGFKIRMQL